MKHRYPTSFQDIRYLDRKKHISSNVWLTSKMLSREPDISNNSESEDYSIVMRSDKQLGATT
jgi:hypothetical protein